MFGFGFPVGLLTLRLQFATLFQSFLHDIVVSEQVCVDQYRDLGLLGSLYSLLNDGRCAQS
jgi:hypothetical protein